MKIIFLLFNGITWLDFFGIYEVLCRINTMEIDPNTLIDFSFQEPGITDINSLTISGKKIMPLLSSYDMLIIPGGKGTRTLVNNETYIDYIKTWDENKLLVSVCTGALLAGKAGFLIDKVATTHHLYLDSLKDYCKQVEQKRIIKHGNRITTGGVSASLDAGLYLVELYYGKTAREKIMYQIEYYNYEDNMKNSLIIK